MELLTELVNVIIHDDNTRSLDLANEIPLH